jgi:hypothetical protein
MPVPVPTVVVAGVTQSMQYTRVAMVVCSTSAHEQPLVGLGRVLLRVFIPLLHAMLHVTAVPCVRSLTWCMYALQGRWVPLGWELQPYGEAV